MNTPIKASTSETTSDGDRQPVATAISASATAPEPPDRENTALSDGELSDVNATECAMMTVNYEAEFTWEDSDLIDPSFTPTKIRGHLYLIVVRQRTDECFSVFEEVLMAQAPEALYQYWAAGPGGRDRSGWMSKSRAWEILSMDESGQSVKVHWLGYPPSEATLEPVARMQRVAKAVLATFRTRNGLVLKHGNTLVSGKPRVSSE